METNALNLALEGLALPEASTSASVRAKLRYSEAMALASLGRFHEAVPLFRQAEEALEDSGDLENAARSMGAFGIACLNAGDPEQAELHPQRSAGDGADPSI